ncbi:MAG: hypothetical protein JWM04_580 [Verrucomicrobiales bacterium]|nr:hypothetical protein [Verrucomicrobiales bacterium]
MLWLQNYSLLTSPIANPGLLETAAPESAGEDNFRTLCHLLRLSLQSLTTDHDFLPHDPAALFACAKSHRVAGLVARLFPSASKDSNILEGLCATETDRNNLLGLINLAELGKITNLFSAANVPVLALKGPVLSLIAYENMGARSTGDLDILVPPGDVRKSHDLLIELGYKLIIPEELPREQVFERYLSRSPHFTYRKPNQRVVVELHWRIFSNPFYFPVTFQEVYSSRVVVPISKFQLATFAEEYFALHLICHGAHHAWERLFWLHDLALLFKKEKIDPSRLLQTAERLGLERVVGQCFLLLHSIYQIPIPAAVKQLCQKSEVQFLARHALRTCRIFGDHMAPSRSARLLYLLRLRKGSAYRRRVIEHEILQLDKKDFLTVPYLTLPIYAILRPVKVIKGKKEKTKSTSNSG